MVLNYKYRLYPTTQQAHALICSMRFQRRSWNQMVRLTKRCQGRNRLPRVVVRSRLQTLVLTRRATGRRPEAIRKLADQRGVSDTAATELLNAKKLAEIAGARRSGLAVMYAREIADEQRKGSLHGGMGGPFAKLSRIFKESWKSCWDGIRGAPRKKKPKEARSVSVQINNGSIRWARSHPNGRNENWLNLSSLLMPRFRRNAEICNVKVIQHRPLPKDAVVKDLKVTRSSNHAHAEWHVILAVETETAGIKDYPTTGVACGIDPGIKTPLTVAGEDAKIPGQDGFEIDPGKPFEKAKKKLTRLQRKLDRQTRANNPHCFDANGVWIKGQKVAIVSKGMAETRAQIAKLYSRAANVRREVYSLAANDLLNNYDTIYFGDWKDQTPAQKGVAKKKRKKAFAKAAIKRAKGVAAQQRTRNRTLLDHAPAIFRQIVTERVKRSATPKEQFDTHEPFTTQECPCCHELTGPKGRAGLKEREWTCSNCGAVNNRDRASAFNMIGAGRKQQQAAALAVNEVQMTRKGRRRHSMSRLEREVSNAPTPRLKSGRVLEDVARGNLMAQSGEPLATPVSTTMPAVSPQLKTKLAGRNRPARARRSGPLATDNLNNSKQMPLTGSSG